MNQPGLRRHCAKGSKPIEDRIRLIRSLRVFCGSSSPELKTTTEYPDRTDGRTEGNGEKNGKNELKKKSNSGPVRTARKVFDLGLNRVRNKCGSTFLFRDHQTDREPHECDCADREDRIAEQTHPPQSLHEVRLHEL